MSKNTDIIFKKFNLNTNRQYISLDSLPYIIDINTNKIYLVFDDYNSFKSNIENRISTENVLDSLSILVESLNLGNPFLSKIHPLVPLEKSNKKKNSRKVKKRSFSKCNRNKGYFRKKQSNKSNK